MTRNYNFVDNVTAIHDGEEVLPKSYVLKQNYPNPFNTRTTIEFALPEAGEVSLTVYDILGRKVRQSIDGHLDAGRHSVTLDMNEAKSGVYFYVLDVNSINIERKMLLLK